MPGADEFPRDFDAERAAGDPAFTVDLDGFEGPLDLLLELARRQKVDLARISVLALAEQYLLFIEAARKLRLELAADYLVMAAWLAYLKSRLLLPAPPQAAEPDASELADALAQRLRKLEAIRKAAELLMNRPRLGRDFFARGEPEAVEAPARRPTRRRFTISSSAYARQAQKHAHARGASEDAQRLVARRSAGDAGAARRPGDCDWTAFDDWLLEACLDPKMRRSARASTFSASLELVREGKIELRQEKTFAPIWIRACPAAAVEEVAA